jgi:F-type H+-transporting ATPase subunit b
VLGVVAKFILPPIQKVLDERAQIIKDSQRASDEGQHEALRLAGELADVLASARAEARALLEEAGHSVEQGREAARARGLVEHDEILAQAAAGIDADRTRVRAEVIGRLDAIVIAAAEQVIGTEITPSRHRDVIRQALDAADAAASR